MGSEMCIRDSAMQAYLQQEKQALMAVMPEFGDAEKATKIREKLVHGGSEFYGYSPEEIGNVMDHRAIMVLKDAGVLAAREAGFDGCDAGIWRRPEGNQTP